MLELNKIYCGDCLDFMRSIPDNKIDCIITDPPYRITSRGNAGNSGGMLTTNLSLKGKIFENNEIDIEDYLPEFYRILKEGTHCYIMCNNTNLVHFLKVIDSSPFHFIKCLIWDKQNKIMGTYYMSCYEYILFMRKGKDRQINNCGTPDLLSVPNKKDKDRSGKNLHDSQKPVRLFQTLVENSTNKGDLVLDPFCGSGTLPISCKRTDRNFLAFEISEQYVKTAQQRLNAETAQMKLFEF